MRRLDAAWILGLGGALVRFAQTGLAFAVTPQNTLVLAVGGEPLILTVAAPAAVAGTLAFAPSDLFAGPVPIVAPGLAAAPAVGQSVAVRGAIWAHDGSGAAPSRTWQWRADGVEIPGATSPSYTPLPGQAGVGLSVVETASDGFGARSAVSDEIAVSA